MSALLLIGQMQISDGAIRVVAHFRGRPAGFSGLRVELVLASRQGVTGV